jgi:hypothetical protein
MTPKALTSTWVLCTGVAHEEVCSGSYGADLRRSDGIRAGEWLHKHRDDTRSNIHHKPDHDEHVVNDEHHRPERSEWHNGAGESE